jgi:maltooligosyltrehalose trehalohydrolase
MQVPDVHTRSLGITFDAQGQAKVVVWAPLVKQLKLRLCRSGTELSLEKQTEGYWQLSTSKIKPGDRYKFVLDGKQLPDPVSLSQPEGVHGPSQALDLNQFSWTDQAWKNFPLEEYIFYELHAGTFTGSGRFDGILEKLPYLKSLGITAIEIMPVAQFPGKRNWGYDGVFPFAVHEAYGGAQELQSLVNACHHHGIAVVLDVVYNHVGPEGNYFSQFASYFTDKYKTPWGDAINFDDAWCDGVRRYMIENALMWFRDFHIDALRLDAVHAIKDFSPQHILADMHDHIDKFMKDTGNVHYLIAELDLNDTRFIRARELGGYGMDAQWIDEFHHALRVTAGQERTGYYADFDGMTHLVKAFRDAYVYDGQYSPHRKKHFGVKADGFDGNKFVVFSQNHDQVGNRMLGERTSKLVSFSMLKVLAAATLLSPYLPLLFMGEEYGETNPFLYFVHHGDETLIKNVREGRKAEFADFHNQGEAPDPQSEETFWNSKLQWHLTDEGKHHQLFMFYQQLISLRKQHAVLCRADRNQMNVYAQNGEHTLLLHRWHMNDHVSVCMNFSTTIQSVSLPSGLNWQKILDSNDKHWGGSGVTSEMTVTKSAVALQPESILLCTARHV